jgi:hypothetical protein
MTGLLHEKELSRKSFVKGGGALVVGFSLAGAATAGKASAASGNTPFGQRGPQDYLPNLQSIDSWLAITADNRVIVTHGEPEFGTGTTTGILMLVAEELDTNMEQMVYARPDSWLNSTGGGGGSGGISQRSTQIRAAAAYARQQLLGMASAQLGIPVSGLSVAGGVVTGGGKTVTYGALIGGRLFNYTMPLDPASSTSTTATKYLPGGGISKPVAQYQLVGRQIPRWDIPPKVTGSYTYVQSVHVPGMVHARSVRPRGAGANTSVNHEPLSVDPSSVSHIPRRGGRTDEQLARRLGAEGVRRDPGRSPAQGRVEERPEVHPLRELLVVDAAGGRHEHGQPRPLHGRYGRRSGGARCGGPHGDGDVPLPLQQLRPDRPACGRRGRAGKQRDRLHPGPADRRDRR